MNPEMISRPTTSARILFTGAAAALALGTALASARRGRGTRGPGRADPGTITTVAAASAAREGHHGGPRPVWRLCPERQHLRG
jgi:hypothetical protein